MEEDRKKIDLVRCTEGVEHEKSISMDRKEKIIETESMIVYGGDDRDKVVVEYAANDSEINRGAEGLKEKQLGSFDDVISGLKVMQEEVESKFRQLHDGYEKIAKDCFEDYLKIEALERKRSSRVAQIVGMAREMNEWKGKSELRIGRTDLELQRSNKLLLNELKKMKLKMKELENKSEESKKVIMKLENELEKSNKVIMKLENESEKSNKGIMKLKESNKMIIKLEKVIKGERS